MSAPGLPCALLDLEGSETKQSSGEQAARMRTHVCQPPLSVIARLVRNCARGRAIQYSETAVIEPRRHGVLDSPPSRGMTASVGEAGRSLILRHCEKRSDEAIQNPSAEKILDCFAALAMTWREPVLTPTALVPRTQRSASSAVRCRAGAHFAARRAAPGSRLCAASLRAAARPGHAGAQSQSSSRRPIPITTPCLD